MTNAITDAPVAATRARRLKAATEAAHETLDRAIMAGQPFESRDRDVQFLALQRSVQRDIDALYADPALGALLPDLAGGRRLGLIEQDMADLGVGAAPDAAAPAFAPDVEFDEPAALGSLYVAEGSNLGAAFLLKAAAARGLSETFGARHLAGALVGRGLRWRTFVAALDGAALSEAEEAGVVAGAEAAFARVQELARQILG
ncbi:biliverdin-producing heme oxygenase [Methylopila sp. 73B]|uniref:biliverdin-producing heme oxygenase n=1 Tax=Methylopila sp. 73B TaxID=1120792 RepID=UPI0003749723|nr:biliverdin-producing heme oxygenase [Methylopila sp. 73B]